MKRSVAIVLSLLLLWVQAFVVASPVRAAQPAPCQCCNCKRMDCCVAAPESPAAPLPAATAPIVTPGLEIFALTLIPAWTLPGEASAALPCFSLSPLAAARVPLFARHCALLI